MLPPTLTKNVRVLEFQRLYTPSAFREERILWRAVIQLNLVRSVRKILDAISDHQDAIIESTSGGEDDFDDDTPYIHPDLHELKMRLLPLRHIEQLLIAKLVPPGEDEASGFGYFPASAVAPPAASSASMSVASGSINSGRYTHGYSHSISQRNQEIFVRPGMALNGNVARGKGSIGGRLSNGSNSLDGPDEPTIVIHECCRDIQALWRDRSAREILRRRKIKLEEQSGLYAPCFVSKQAPYS